MATSSVRVLVVDDYERWRRFVTSTLQKRSGVLIVGEASDGSEAVEMTQELHPNLVLLDIGLPTLNGIEAAREIRKVSPTSKILFVSENSSADIAEEALSTGASGYVVKLDAARALLPAVEAVLAGKRFLSASLSGHDLADSTDKHRADSPHRTNVVVSFPPQTIAIGGHEVAFYADDTSLVNGYARYIESALKMGHAVIVVVTESHRANLIRRLRADGVDVDAAIEQGNYIPLDVTDTLSKLTVDDMPDPVRCAEVIGDFVVKAIQGLKGEHARVVVCGETAPTLLSKGNAEGAIQLEHLWNDISRDYGVHTLCGYLSSAFRNGESSSIFQRICAEHSAIHGENLVTNRRLVEKILPT